MPKVYDLDTKEGKINFYSRLSKDYELLGKYFTELSERIKKDNLYTKDLFYKIDSAINKTRRYSCTRKNIIDEYEKSEWFFNTLDYISSIHHTRRYDKE